VTPQAITPSLATALGLQQTWGVILADVAPDGPADNAGLKIGDVILSVDGAAIRDVPDFSTHVHHHPIDTTLAMDVMRDWQHLTLRVQVAQYPDDPGRFLNRVDSQKNRVPQLGILGIEIDAQIAGLLAPLRKDNGVLVVAIDSEDTTPDDRLLPGDIIHALNKMPITTLTELKAVCEKLKENDSIVVQVERQGKMIFITFDESATS
jgi:serine protease Do